MDVAKIAEAAEMINAAKKPFIVWGQGLTLGNAETNLKTLLKKQEFLLHQPF